MKEWLGQQKTKKKLGRHHARARKQYEIGAEANDTEEYKCVKPVRLREGETRRQAIKRVKDGDEVCSKEGEVYPGMEKATNANKLQCLNYCTSEYLPPSQETNASEQGPPPASEPSQRSRPASRENSNAAPNKERGLVLSSKKSKNSSVVPFDESKLPKVPEEKTEDEEEAPSAPEKKEEGEEEKPKDTKPKVEKKSKRQKAWDYTKRKRNELRGKMKDTQREIKELEPDPLKVGPVTVPASVVGFIEKNAKRFELIGLALWDFPFELTFHFFKEIGHIVSFSNLMPAFLNHKTQEFLQDAHSCCRISLDRSLDGRRSLCKVCFRGGFVDDCGCHQRHDYDQRYGHTNYQGLCVWGHCPRVAGSSMRFSTAVFGSALGPEKAYLSQSRRIRTSSLSHIQHGQVCSGTV